LGEILGKRMKGFEKSVYDLKMKCKERTMKAKELQGRLEQKEKDLEEVREQLEEKRRECKGNEQSIQGLVWQIREINREMDAKQAYANN
jgi:predicted  nucleic acid-binding Zn-ribbon protein